MDQCGLFTIRPPLRTTVDVDSHASVGNGKPYPKEMREMVIRRHILDLPRVDDSIRLLQLEHQYPSDRTIRRWIEYYEDNEHILPFSRTGNKMSEREVMGEALFNLALIRAVKPKSLICEVKAFVYSAVPGDAAPYSDSQICRAESLIGLSRKAASTTSFDAYLPVNLMKRHLYFNAAYPGGIADIDPRNVIDCDEMGLEIEHQNRSFGKSAKGNRCNQAGVYTRNQKLNVLMAISGCDVTPSRWVDTWTGEGTTLHRFYAFILRIVNDIDKRFPG